MQMSPGYGGYDMSIAQAADIAVVTPVILGADRRQCA